MFTTSKQIEVRIVSGGPKVILVRYPSDEEWCARLRKMRVITNSLGRGQTKSDTEGAGPADTELLAKISIDGDAAAMFDQAEASLVITKLSRAEVTAVAREGDLFAITLKVAGAVVVHRLRIPRQADIVEYRRGSMSTVNSRRAAISHVFLEPGALWDKVQASVEGYEGPVPIVHKDAAIDELLAQVNELAEECSPED